MFRLTRPTSFELATFLDKQRGLEPSYPEIGMTHPDTGSPPGGYTSDTFQLYLGQGDAVFQQAREQLRAWRMYQQSWLSLYPRKPDVCSGTVACVTAQHLGFYSVSAVRVVYVVDEPEQLAFAVGTLPGHVEKGEERFRVYRLGGGSVWFDILAYSKPNHPLVRLGYPVARQVQKRFARGAEAALLKLFWSNFSGGT